MNEDRNDMTRREWMRRVAVAAVAAGVVPVLSSCRNDGCDTMLPRTVTRDDESDPFDAEKIIASLPGDIDCVECGRCMPCGFGVDIPSMFSEYNAALKAGEIPADAIAFTNGEGFVRAHRFVDRIEKNIGDRHLAHRCALCGKCHKNCPKKLPIAKYMRAIGRFIDLTRETESMI